MRGTSPRREIRPLRKTKRMSATIPSRDARSSPGPVDEQCDEMEATWSRFATLTENVAEAQPRVLEARSKSTVPTIPIAMCDIGCLHAPIQRTASPAERSSLRRASTPSGVFAPGMHLWSDLLQKRPTCTTRSPPTRKVYGVTRLTPIGHSLSPSFISTIPRSAIARAQIKVIVPAS